MRRAKCFGINLAKLDIRQESSRHSQLINELVQKKNKQNYLKWSEEEKIKFLSSKMKKKSNSSKILILKIKKTKKFGQHLKFYLKSHLNVWGLMLFQ